jgi:hypothetical protein
MTDAMEAAEIQIMQQAPSGGAGIRMRQLGNVPIQQGRGIAPQTPDILEWSRSAVAC